MSSSTAQQHAHSATAVAIELQVSKRTNDSDTSMRTPSTPHSVSPDFDQTNQASVPPATHQIIAAGKKDTKCERLLKLMRNFSFCIRIVLLLLVLFLSFLSISYCIAQLLEAKLVLITECPEPKTREEIWAHSYEASLKYDDDHKINKETQYGFTNESCWTTKQFEVNTNQLWYSNKYEFEWHANRINAMFVVFGLVFLYCVAIVVYIVYGSMVDIVHALRGTLYTKCSAYIHDHVQQDSAQKEKEYGQQSRARRACNVCAKLYFELYLKYLSQDTTGWIIRKFSSEVTEITLQSIALCLYNGYHIMDPNNENDTYLALKPQFINLFAAWIAFNCFGSGILWLFYATMSHYCYGLKFERLLFFVDKFSDFLYTIFPFVVLLYDDYNQATDDYAVFLAQLNIESGLSFFAAFVPLFFLCNQCLLMAHRSMTRLRRQYFDEYEARISSNLHASDKIAIEEVMRQNTTREEWDKNWIHKDTQHNPRLKHVKRGIVVCLSIVLVTFGVFFSVFVTKHNQNTMRFCQSAADSLYDSTGNIKDEQYWSDQLRENPELFAWNHCLYKVYPFVHENKYRCQCRVFVMEDWYDYESSYDQRAGASSFNLTQHNIIDASLQHWFMLEKFRSSGTEAPVYMTYALNASMYNARHMKVFEWSEARMSHIGEGISYWKKLEYFKLDGTLFIATLPADIGELRRMKILELNQVGLSEFPNAVCNMTQLLSLRIMGNNHIEDAVPHCISNLVEAKEIIIDWCLQIDAVPLSLFNMPNLIDLSLFKMNLTYSNLLQYNLPPDIDMDDNTTTDEWFNDNFAWNNHTTYWLHNALCDYEWWEWQYLPSSLLQFLSFNKTECNTHCSNEFNGASASDTLCYPRNWGDGKCDFYCMIEDCSFDGGDCFQLCFSELTPNCSYDDRSWLIDEKCTQSPYCQHESWIVSYDGTLSSQLDTNISVHVNYTSSCPLSSNYVASPAQYFLNYAISTNALWDVPVADFRCYPRYVGDGLCQDLCRTEECGYDSVDCNSQCRRDWCAEVYTLWIMAAASAKYITFEHFCQQFTLVLDVQWFLEEWSWENTDVDCLQMSPLVDLDGDGLMNFKEFVTFVQVMGAVFGFN